MTRIIALVAARDEAGRVGHTVEAVRSIEPVQEVIVADGGSTDTTAQEALDAGARVLVGPAAGKGQALEAALARVGPAEIYVFLDADLGPSAKEGAALVAEVASGRADLAIGVLPRDPRHGGFRIVKRTAAAIIAALSGFRAAEPLSGQRALRRDCLDAVRPLAPGFGVEPAMTIDAVRAGFRVAEVPVGMIHEPTGRDLAGFVHRGRQAWDLLRAAVPRAIR